MQTSRTQTGVTRSASHGIKKALQTLTYLHYFAGCCNDGAHPFGRLLGVNGTLYGTTSGGGSNNAGTVYSITPSGTFNELYSFAGDPDGQNPRAGLVDLNGVLYGTTVSGGASNTGTVYSITTGGTESVIQSFYSGSYGSNPYAGLIAANGSLYGTASTGGVYNVGTVFSITPAGVQTVLHQFGGSGDGTNPLAPLLKVGSMLYGTTTSGGTNGSGTLFAIAKSSGHETLLHSFGAGADGFNPQYGQLANLNGTLYGTTQNGGANNEGTIYSIGTTGSSTYTTVYNFAGGADGCNPVGGLVVFNGVLYGTARGCGTYNAGTIFAFDPTANTTTPVWAFGNSPGGATPSGDLVVVGHTIYGTTANGGPYGAGTVFSFVSTL